MSLPMIYLLFGSGHQFQSSDTKILKRQDLKKRFFTGHKNVKDLNIHGKGKFPLMLMVVRAQTKIYIFINTCLKPRLCLPA